LCYWWPITAPGNRSKQLIGVWVSRPLKNALDGPRLHEAPQKHHRNAIGDIPNHRQIMGNKQIRRPVALLEINQ